MSNNLISRVRSLELENQKLRQTLLTLTERLSELETHALSLCQTPDNPAPDISVPTPGVSTPSVSSLDAAGFEALVRENERLLHQIRLYHCVMDQIEDQLLALSDCLR